MASKARGVSKLIRGITSRAKKRQKSKSAWEKSTPAEWKPKAKTKKELEAERWLSRNRRVQDLPKAEQAKIKRALEKAGLDKPPKSQIAKTVSSPTTKARNKASAKEFRQAGKRTPQRRVQDLSKEEQATIAKALAILKQSQGVTKKKGGGEISTARRAGAAKKGFGPAKKYMGGGHPMAKTKKKSGGAVKMQGGGLSRAQQNMLRLAARILRHCVR